MVQLRRFISFMVLAALMAAMPGMFAAPRVAEAAMSTGCDSLNSTGSSGSSSIPGTESLTAHNLMLNAGEQIAAVLTLTQGSSNVTFNLEFNAAVVDTATAFMLTSDSMTLTYTVPTTGTADVGFWASFDAPHGFDVAFSCTVPGAPQPVVETVVVPGCDVLMPLSETAVVGAFTATTQAYWMPGKLSDVALEAGKTAWVLGVDESGAYYKILWSCDVLWVPVGTMGPNFDDVWQGTPLPTGVVQ